MAKLITNSKNKTYTASDAKNKFAELIDDAQRAPVAIERHGRQVAYVVSPADIAMMEDYYLGTKAKESVKRGASLSTDESEVFLKHLAA